jgi:hypothetical protein
LEVTPQSQKKIQPAAGPGTTNSKEFRTTNLISIDSQKAAKGKVLGIGDKM